MPLCRTCMACVQGTARIKQNLFPDSNSAEYFHHEYAKGLIQAAKEGCSFCTKVLLDLKKAQPGNIDDHAGFFVFVSQERYGVNEYRGGLKYEIMMSGFGGTGKDIVLYLFPSSPLNDPISPNSTTSTASETTLRQVSTWLSQCTANHACCRDGCDPTWYPTRLLDVAPRSANGTVQLIETRCTPPRSSYAALSHCWGSDDFFRLTHATHPVLNIGCEVGRLSRTFRHAITVCRAIGIRYLWIDSLCILQDRDDLADWTREASKMGNVYANAICTIAAAASRKSDEGLFRNRTPVERLEINRAQHPKYVPCTGQYVLSDHCLYLNVWEAMVEHAPLNRRAWVLQERFLSPRTVYFSNDQIWWECREVTANEDFPKSAPVNYGLLTNLTKKRLQLGLKGHGDRAYKDWKDIRTAYSNASLTRPEDRVIAISGIAKSFQAALSDTYIAGMWMSRLRKEMLWRAKPQHDALDVLSSSKYRAPSFSWLSLEYPVEAVYPYAVDAFYFDVKDINMQYATGDTTALITSGELLIDAPLLPISFEQETSPDRSWKWTITNAKRVRPEVYPDHGRPDLPISSKQNQHFWMPCSGWSNEIYWRAFHGLLLEVVDAKWGCYRRIGLVTFSILGNKESTGPREYLKELSQSAPFACVAYDKETDRHNFRLV